MMNSLRKHVVHTIEHFVLHSPATFSFKQVQW